MVIQRRSYIKSKVADHSLTLQWASVWLQNKDDPDSAILSDRVTAELIISRLCKIQPWRRSRIYRSAVGPMPFFRTHTAVRVSAVGTLSASISMIHRTLVSKNTERKKKLKFVVFWDLTHSSLVTVCGHFGETSSSMDRDSVFLRKVNKFQLGYTASQTRRGYSLWLLPWESILLKESSRFHTVTL
jgi:hypothetical protein